MRNFIIINYKIYCGYSKENLILKISYFHHMKTGGQIHNGQRIQSF